MSYQQILIPSVVGTVNIVLLILIALSAFSHLKQNPLGLRKFFYLALTVILFSISFMGAFLSIDPYYFNCFLQFMLATQMCLGSLCLLFFLDMGDFKNSKLPKIKKFLYIIIMLHIVISFTNGHHHLLYTEAIKEPGNLSYIIKHGIWFQIMYYYSLFILLLTCAVMLSALLGKNKKNFSVTLSTFLSFVITSSVSILYSKGLFPTPLNPVGFFLCIPAFIIYYACFEYLGKARAKAVDFMEDAYFVFDLKGSLIDKNESAEKFIANYCHADNFDLNTIGRLIGADEITKFKDQEFSINQLDAGENFFKATYFYVSDSISQICGHGILLREITEFKEQVNQLNTAANIDALTGVRNRRYFDLYTTKLYKKHLTPKSYITLLLLDLDHFKRINDTYGHSVGDEVLKAFCNICLENLRAEDILFRYGGEEFIIIIDGANAAAGLHAAERILHAVGQKPIHTSKGPINITVSIGGCSNVTGQTVDICTLVETADKLMYNAKNAGRNRVEFLDLLPAQN